MGRICIFCRESQTDFNEEHVFPAAIGGAFVISSVCKDCNTILGVNIDNPFNKHEFILVYRNELNITRKDKRRKSNIPNPFKGTHKDDEGNEVRFEYDKDGKIVSHLLPNYKTSEVEGGLMVEITVPLKDADEEKLKQQVSKKFGLDLDSLVILDKKIKAFNPPSKINFSALNNPFILGCVKIAYETGITFIPAYFNDPFSKAFADILLLSNIQEYQRRFYKQDESLMESLTKRVQSIPGLQLHQHAILLTTVSGKGLCCVVRVFNWMYTVCLSDREDYLKTDLVIINDSVHRTWWLNVPSILTNCVVVFDLTKLNQEQQDFLRREQESGLLAFKTPDGTLPIFNSEGLLLFQNIDELAKNLNFRPEYFDHNYNALCIPVVYNENLYFLKLIGQKVYIPILSIGFIYQCS